MYLLMAYCCFEFSGSKIMHSIYLRRKIRREKEMIEPQGNELTLCVFVLFGIGSSILYTHSI